MIDDKSRVSRLNEIVGRWIILNKGFSYIRLHPYRQISICHWVDGQLTLKLYGPSKC